MLPLPPVPAIRVAQWLMVLTKAGGVLLAGVLAREGLAVPTELATAEGAMLFAGVLAETGGLLINGERLEAAAAVASDVLAKPALTSTDA